MDAGRIEVAFASAAATARQAWRHRVLRSATQVSLGTAHVAVYLKQIARIKTIGTIRHGVTRLAASEATQRLGVSTGAAHVRTVARLVTRNQTVEAQAVRTVSSDVRLESTEVARFFLCR